MKQNSPKMEVKFVEYLGEIGCGRPVEALDNVYPFIAKSELIPIALPANVNARDAGIMTVRGLSLTDFNIFDGDRLVIRKDVSWRDVGEDTICVIYIHATGELAAKRIVRGANKLTLRASGGAIPDKDYAIDEIELRGIVSDFLVDINTQISRAREAKARQNAIGRRKRDELTPRLWNEKSNDDIPY